MTPEAFVDEGLISTSKVTMITRRNGTTNRAFRKLTQLLSPVDLGDLEYFGPASRRFPTEGPVVLAVGTSKVVSAILIATVNISANHNDVKKLLVLTFEDMTELRTSMRFVGNVHRHCMSANIILRIVIESFHKTKRKQAKYTPLSFKRFVKERLILILGLPTSGKSTFIDLAAKGEIDAVCWDTDLYWVDKPDISDQDLKSMMLTGAFFSAMRDAYSWYTEHKSDRTFFVLTNLWNREITLVLEALGKKYDLAAFLKNPAEVVRRSQMRGGTKFELDVATKWIDDAKKFYSKVSDEVVMLDDYEYLSDLLIERYFTENK